MKIFLTLLLFSVIITPGFAEDWDCFKKQVVTVDYSKVRDQCRPYQSYKLNRPIVSRSSKK